MLKNIYLLFVVILVLTACSQPTDNSKLINDETTALQETTKIETTQVVEEIKETTAAYSPYPEPEFGQFYFKKDGERIYKTSYFHYETEDARTIQAKTGLSFPEFNVDGYDHVKFRVEIDSAPIDRESIEYNTVYLLDNPESYINRAEISLDDVAFIYGYRIDSYMISNMGFSAQPFEEGEEVIEIENEYIILQYDIFISDQDERYIKVKEDVMLAFETIGIFLKSIEVNKEPCTYQVISTLDI